MAKTTRHKIKGKYKKACSLWIKNNYTWLNWHKHSLYVKQVQVIKRYIEKDFYGLKITLVSHDGHGWAEFDLCPKNPGNQNLVFFSVPNWWNTIHHIRPARRKNKFLLHKCLTNPESWYNMNFRDYKKPQEYYW